jgi:cell division septation protein DedD
MLGKHLNEEFHDGELDPVHEPHRDTELTLSSITLLALFFGLVLLCGAFFGIGYTVGRHSSSTPVAAGAPAAPTNSPVVVEAATTASSALPKPSASAQAGLPQAATTTPASTPAPADTVSTPPAPAPAPTPAAVSHPAPVAPVSAPAAPKPAAKAPLTAKAAPEADTSSSALMVQIASVSHQEDADVLVEALRKRGYNVSVHHDIFGDNMLHVQIGPFPDRTSAYAMRQKLLNDGYNAIVRP